MTMFLTRQLFLKGIIKTNTVAGWVNGWLGCYSLPSSPAVPSSPSSKTDGMDQFFNVHAETWSLSPFQKLAAGKE